MCNINPNCQSIPIDYSLITEKNFDHFQILPTTKNLQKGHQWQTNLQYYKPPHF